MHAPSSFGHLPNIPPDSPESPEGSRNTSKVSKRGWREGVGDQLHPKHSKNVPQNCVLLLLRGHRKKGAEKRPEFMVWEGFLAPTPSVRQPLFETPDLNPFSANCFLALTTQTPLIKGVAFHPLIKGVGVKKQYKTRGFEQSAPVNLEGEPPPP